MKKNSNIKAVLFDMDGLVINSEPIQSLSHEILIKEYGETPIYHKSGLIQMVGTTGDRSYIEILEKHGIKEDLKIYRKKRREIFLRLFSEKKVQPVAGFLKIIKTLKQKKIKTALVSNRMLDHVILITKNLGINNLFDVIVAHDNSVRPKPFPDLYIKTAKQLRVKPKECIVLEDAEPGVIAGKAAGMKVIAIPNRFTKHQNFEKADKIVNSLEDITLPLLQNMISYIKNS